MAWVERFIARMPRYSGTLLIGVGLLTALALAQIVDPFTGQVQLRADPSMDRLLPEGDDTVAFYEQVRDRFGKDETLLVAVHSDDLFTSTGLARIERLTQRIEQLEGVHHVLSIANARDIRGVDDDIVIQPFFADLPESGEGRAELRRRVLENPIYGGNLVSRDGKTAALVVYFRDMSHREYAASGLDPAIERIANEESAGAEVWITGGPHIRAVTARVYFEEALSTLPGLILAALGGVLLFSFRTLRGVVLPLATIVISVVWTLAIAVVAGYQLNTVTILVPVLLTTLGFSYSVHVVSEYYDDEDTEGTDRRARVGAAMARVALPVTLTGVTTAAGFAALMLSPLPAVREFGLLSVVGVICSVVASLTFTPAALALLRGGSGPRFSFGGFGWSFDRLAERVARFDLANRHAIFVGAFVVFLIGIYGATQIRVGTQQVSKFRPDAPVRVHFEAINEHLQGANLLFVVLRTEEPDGFKEPVVLAEIEQLQGWLDEQPEVGGTTSLVDYLKLINRAFHSDDPAFAAIPPSRRAVAELLFFGGGEELRPVVDQGFQTAMVRVRANVIDSDDVTLLTKRIERRLEELPEPLTARVTGTAVVLNTALDSIIVGQARSVIAALGIIYVILALLFVSPRVGAIALIPNVLPVAVYFGALGLTGMRLHSGTSLIAPMVLGIAVDDTIHYFARFIRESRRLGSEERATVSALKSVGRPVSYTTAGLCLGFMMLNFSQLGLAAEVGSMAAFALGFAWLTDFLLTPALCARMRIATLWDFLLIDLGGDPQRSLTLLHGLRASQARIVALMARLLDLPAGQRLYAAGEPGEALYMVVSGRLRTTLPGENGSRELAEHERGDVIGEAGLFHQQHITTVDVLEPTRLLRISESSLDHLCRRYPRIAAIVFRNLNGLIAGRMAEATVGRVFDGEARDPSDALLQRSRALEQAFFQKEAGAQRERLVADVLRPERRLEELSEHAAEDRAPIETVAGLGLRADTSVALLLTPLIEVAWADGQVDDGERRELLRAAEAHGITAGSPSFDLLRIWLDQRPGADLMRTWSEFAQALCGELSVETRIRLGDAILGNARAVAGSAGGFLGLAAISRSEERVLATLAKAFGER